ncbi:MULTISPECIES: hypothetical protein [unclassified Pseudomonas]|uniref:hypothetical protein n=1 Tax=unclassified Pseudomonas TaxID=196821 RepID=UPI002AC89EF0|nr:MULTISPECIES: hypothetical protein [unclassified Pseudomonas]MEB0041977.1 hypothetical protein [Pseudomonas sp. MH10]MEB0079097.1 hypothetical protein [Pseudomonas sp. MH10out]MEB0092096.1 hypothetical protein [Pseudomonas sp. CCI4.2]MEB0100479.1 hypothetical protein [Pseudomonas sp. CCI3.2]MEB0123626.1 hypothetical protein [Pseudomonas sp. CCI1.2]
MDQISAIEHFLHDLKHHPAVEYTFKPQVLIGYTDAYSALVSNIIETALEDDSFRFSAMNLNTSSTDSLKNAIIENDLYMLLYDTSTQSDLSTKGPGFIQELRTVMNENPKKSLLLKNYGRFF